MEFDEETKILKSINLEDFSIEDLEDYIESLQLEINRSESEIKKRVLTKKEAQKFFK